MSRIIGKYGVRRPVKNWCRQAGCEPEVVSKWMSMKHRTDDEIIQYLFK